jgi:hypothetical protein
VEIINTVLALDKLINIYQSARLALTEKCNFIKAYKKSCSSNYPRAALLSLLFY